MNSIDIEIDKLTPCLENRETGELIDTQFNKITVSEVKGLKRRGWNFDWSRPFKDGFEVYKLVIRGNTEIQGLVALKEDVGNKAVYVEIVENAPRNIGQRGIYKGVGGHLFAIAVKVSMEKGFGGYVYFVSKSDLIEHYERELGAELKNPRLRIMAIEELAAEKIYKHYFKD